MVCKNCGKDLVYIGAGKYKCKKCKSIIINDFFKVKQFLKGVVECDVSDIEEETGVSADKIESFFGDDKLKWEDVIRKNEIKVCENCGVKTINSRYCKKCKEKLCMGLQSSFSKINSFKE